MIPLKKKDDLFTSQLNHAELNVISIMITNATKLPLEKIKALKRWDFHCLSHGILFHAVKHIIVKAEQENTLDLYQDKFKIAFETVDLLKKHQLFEQAGGAQIITDLTFLTPSRTAEEVKRCLDLYIRDIMRKAQYRSVIKRVESLHNKLNNLIKEDDGIDIISLSNEVIAEWMSVIKNYSPESNHKIITSGDIIKEMTDTWMQGQDNIIATGLSSLDKLLKGGIRKSNFLVIAGRPTMGKTTLALNIAANVAQADTNKAVLVCSMEMSRSEIILKLISSLAEVEDNDIRKYIISGKKNKFSNKISDIPDINQETSIYDKVVQGTKFQEETACDRIHWAIDQLTNNIKIIVNDEKQLTPALLRNRALEIKHMYGDLSLIVIDYIQLMSLENSSESQTYDLTKITRAIKMLAQELDVPIIGLAQLNRSVESRDNKRPMMSDLRGSGTIEQDADIIAFLYREAVYNQVKSDQDVQRAEIIVSKHRTGPIGTIFASFQGKFSLFKTK